MRYEIKNPRMKKRVVVLHDLFLDCYYVGTSAPAIAEASRIVTAHVIQKHAKESELQNGKVIRPEGKKYTIASSELLRGKSRRPQKS